MIYYSDEAFDPAPNSLLITAVSIAAISMTKPSVSGLG